MTPLARITQAIQRTEDRKLLRLLNRAFWREFFRQQKQETYQPSTQSAQRRAA
jgi:hypothetical protein